MYTELVPIDLPTVVKVALAENVDIRQAREIVEAQRGQYESAVGAAFPVLVPTAFFERFDGGFRNTDGRIFQVGSTVFQPSVGIEWITNPGRVVYGIIAARKRLSASEHDEDAVKLETLRRAASEFYELVLAQAQVATAEEGVAEARELLRVNRLRVKAGTGVPADELRAEALLAARQQDLVAALNRFYEASIALTVTLHLDSSATLVPKMENLSAEELVRADLQIEKLLANAVAWRPDLQSVRTLAEVLSAEEQATLWSGFGPEFILAYRYGGITGHANNVVPAEGVPGNLIVNPLSPTGAFSANPVANGLIREGILRGSQKLDSRGDRTFTFRDQQYVAAGAGLELSLSTFGELKTADARYKHIMLEAVRRLDVVRSQVVRAAQASKTQRELIALAQQQVASAEEALRLTQANLEAGTMTTLDVLQAQDAATQARLRSAEAVVRYNQSQVDLLAAIGLLDAATLLGTGSESE
jgi:outer membrane protein TolC